MAGGTHVFDMIKKLRENRALKEKGYFKTKNASVKKSDSLDIHYNSASPEDRAKIKAEVLRENETARKRAIKVFLLSFIVTVILVLIIVFLVNQMW